MVNIALLQILGLAVASLAVATLSLWVFSKFEARARKRSQGFASQTGDGLAFLFEGEALVNASPEAQGLLNLDDSMHTDWQQFLNIFSSRFPTLLSEMETLPEKGKARLESTDGLSEMVAEFRNGLVRISLQDSDSDNLPVGFDRHSLSAMEQELETLRATADAAPFMVWRQNGDGAITWANSAYVNLAQLCDPDALVPAWPPARLFAASQLQGFEGQTRPQRITAHIPGEIEPRWFEVYETPIGQDTLFTAVAADSVVSAEVALREFVQTLTKTFAHLKIGLAVFDKERRLTLFNPALTYLTTLQPEFLTGRPTLRAVLDRLRDKRMIPEPRDYKSWRQQIHELESAAKDGSYEETWSLENGQTFNVTGRPHPDGALAFLIEDISAEISLTRRFRSELEAGQAVLDSLSEAIAVFSPGGTLTLSNAAYARLWGVEPEESLAESGIVDTTKAWAEACAPTPVWGDLREFAGAYGERAEWTAEVRLKDGRLMACRFAPLSGGATLAGFSLVQASNSSSAPQLEKPGPSVVSSVIA